MKGAPCLTPMGCLDKVTDSFWGSLSSAINTAAGEMLTTLFGWWIETPSLDVQALYIRQAQGYVTAWIAIPVAVLAIFAAVAWGVLGGGLAWGADVARGLLIFGVVAAGSLPIIDGLQSWADALSAGFLGAVPTEGVGARYLSVISTAGVRAPLLGSLWALIMLIAAIIQYLLMLFRDGALLVLTAVLPLAAAGQFSRGSMLWLPKVLGWLIALVFFKPAAALVYFIGFKIMAEGQGMQSLATAICTMLAAIFALPAMLSLVSFAASPPAMNSTAVGSAASVAGLAVSATQAQALQGVAGAAPPPGAQPVGAQPPGAEPPGPGANGGAAAAAGDPATTAQEARVP
ncbi:hypothetical protein Kisp01_50100 [Kineosporia sp. NBRC 101677]|uniref:hypothetical protein n=1 Tax=Kineosporia sp. NBRC 101677 TaxID=3032197 RepID=UPI0024A48144|nr:hypothetical protein [Kineosporia sp. NBRC 101677]GLY17996.1 hypothetical protein Kisp01_50100 [Kineosporia sp. NBRC 101677]